jgi:putative PIN family toxin of toxin-antitoxin system
MSDSIFVVDTNVLVAGLITSERESPTARVVGCMLSGDLFYLLSPELLSEYRDVLLRPRLLALHGLNESEIDRLLSEITANAIWREALTPARDPSPDPHDAHLWNLLASEPSAVLITGDRLLIEKPLHHRSVISLATWAELF